MITLFRRRKIIMVRAIGLLILVFCLLVFCRDSAAQFKDKMFVSGGLSTMEILGNNWGCLPFLENDRGAWNYDIIGGGFTGAQTGFGMLFTIVLDEDERFRIPIGFDHYFFDGAQSAPYYVDTSFQFNHTLNVTSLVLGFNYAFIRIRLAEAKLYAGIEGRGNFVYNDKFEVVKKIIGDSPDSAFFHPPKENAFRLGGAFVLGVDGKIRDRWYLNIRGGIGIMNLIGRSDEERVLTDKQKEDYSGCEPVLKRGELFTPNIDYECQESLVVNFQFSFFIQYRL